MATAVALAVYAASIGVAAAVVWRRPLAALYVLVPGLALHNVAMAALYGHGVRGGALTAIQAWKEILLAVALARVGWDAARARRLPFRPGLVDALAVAFGVLVLAYALVPQDVLGGEAEPRTVLLGVRHDLIVVGAFLLGRSLPLGRDDLRRLAWTVLGVAGAVAAAGLAADYAVSLDAWARSGAVGYFRGQLGFDYHGPRGLPENFVFNTGDEQHLLRRLVSTFLSPLATGYLLVVALLFAAVAPLPRRLAGAVAALCALALLFTFSRAALGALAAGLLAVALVRRRAWPAAAALATVAIAIAWAHAFPSLAPQDHWSRADLVYQREQAQRLGGVEGGALSAGEPSLHSHWISLREGLRTVVHHPQGFGPGNAGETAARTGTRIKAGESTYAELGIETGLLGMLVFAAWNVLLLTRLFRGAREAWAPLALAAVLLAVLLLAVQTDVLGVPWLAYCLWWLAGALCSAVPLSVHERDRPGSRHRPRPPEGRRHRARASVLP